MVRDSNDPHAPQSARQSGNNSITDRLSQAWDASYLQRKYCTELSLRFTADIIRELKKNPSVMNGRGLYVGCGNGRNYVPLAEAGLDVVGLDVSRVALAGLSKRLPHCSALLHHGDFLDYRQDVPLQDVLFQYVITIQVFQHGDMSKVRQYFAKAPSLLESGGLLFLRVNASDTQVYHKHDIIEKNGTGGFTVRYNEGPKKGLDIRFFSKEGIFSLIRKNNMSVMHGLRNVTTERAPSRTGSWSQWEVITKKD